jgi:hypothetical protein
MTCTIPAEVVWIFSGTVLPIVLTYSLFNDASHLASCLASVDEDIHLSECDATLEIKSLL